jgi:ATP-dependent DNA helicase RecQ
MMDLTVSTLRDRFGHRKFRPLQRETIETLLDGRDAFVLMPTGGGKSLCYQLPALLRPGTAVIASPLLSLMKDQVDALRKRGIRAAAYNSSLTTAESRQVLGRLHAGELELLYVSPERLVRERFLERLVTLKVSLFAIDEAHCVTQWGHDFRPEYRQLGVLKERFSETPRVALTATADPYTRRDIVEQLRLREAMMFVGGFDRPNIHYTVIAKKQPMEQLLAFVRDRQGAAGIVYCMTRRSTEEVAAHLATRGISAAPYHAGLDARRRQTVQEAFLNSRLEVVVATIAFGMGIDKPDVRFVLHFDLPKSIEAYYQETGRAGRDGLPAEALLLSSPSDVIRVSRLIGQGSSPEALRIEHHKLRAMASWAEGTTCRRKALLAYLGEQLAGDCDNCDICLDPPETFDGTEEARMALSCVYRLGQRFGTQYVVDVLMGSAKRRLLDNRHDRLSTYGIGRHHSRDTWYAILRQLVHCGYLEQDLESYSVLRLTRQSRSLLRKEESLRLSLPRPARHQKRRPNHQPDQQEASEDLSGSDGESRHAELSTDPNEEEGWTEADERLFERLRALRRELAEQQSVPAYIVFSNRTLREICRARPTDQTSFRQVVGVGPVKLERYGEPFLKAVCQFESDPR